MKLVFIIISVLSFVGVSFEKDPKCGLNLQYKGSCRVIALGFTYDKTINKCVPTAGPCQGTGNFFVRESDCVTKCNDICYDICKKKQKG